MGKHDNFCCFPFNSFYTYNTGTVRICCDSEIMGRVDGKDLDFESVWNGDRWKEVRKSFIKGERHPACATCWAKEDRGEISNRLNRKAEKFIELAQDDGTMEQAPEELHLRLGNECNLKCIICTPHNSTKWYAEADIYSKYVDQNFGNEIKADLLQSSWSKESFSNAKIILFAGGEPFVIPQHEEILDFLIENKTSQDIELIYYTNGTKVPEHLVNKFKQFSKITLNISIDGVGDQFEYVRYPANWNKVKENLKAIDQLDIPNLEWRIVTVLFNLTIFNIEELFDFRNNEQWKQKPDIILQDLTEPYFFDIRNFNQSNKEIFTEQLSSLMKKTTSDYERSKIQNMIENMNESTKIGQAKSFNILKNYLKELDRKKNTNYEISFPEINQLADNDEYTIRSS